MRRSGCAQGCRKWGGVSRGVGSGRYGCEQGCRKWGGLGVSRGAGSGEVWV